MRLIDADKLHYNRIRIVHSDGIIGGYNAVVMSAEIKDAPPWTLCLCDMGGGTMGTKFKTVRNAAIAEKEAISIAPTAVPKWTEVKPHEPIHPGGMA